MMILGIKSKAVISLKSPSKSKAPAGAMIKVIYNIVMNVWCSLNPMFTFKTERLSKLYLSTQ